MNVLVFDIETVPDIKGAESIWDVDGLSESDVKSFCLLLVYKRHLVGLIF